MGLFRLVFILQSYLLLIFIYLLNHSITIGTILKNLGIESDQVALPDLPNLISYAVYLLIVLIYIEQGYYVVLCRSLMTSGRLVFYFIISPRLPKRNHRSYLLQGFFVYDRLYWHILDKFSPYPSIIP